MAAIVTLLQALILATTATFTFMSSSTTTTSSTTVGVTYDPTASHLPPPEQVVKTLRCLHIPTVRIINPTPTAIRAFSYSNISLLLTVPNHFIPSFAANRSDASQWLYNNVLPFHPRARVSAISIGNDVVSSPSTMSDPSYALLPAIKNVHKSLIELGLKSISVSTTFTFINIMATSFPPSAAEFNQPIYDIVIKPLLQFLKETNSTFMVNVYPYNIYMLRSDLPIGYAVFEEGPFSFRDDIVTGIRYRNLFDMMVDAVISAMAMTGHDNISLIVTETGWPSSGDSGTGGTLPAESEASLAYAETYFLGLISHLKSGLETPLRKGLAGVYIYELFDEENPDSTSDNVTHQLGHGWGIWYRNMSSKYKIKEFSHCNGGGGTLETSPAVLVMVFAMLLLW